MRVCECIARGALELDRASFDYALTRSAQDEVVFFMPSTIPPHPERSAEGAQSNGRTLPLQLLI
jgi:hypothetical protein